MQILCRTASRRSHAASHSRLSPEGTRIYQTPTASSEGAQLAVGVRDGDENFMSDNKKQGDLKLILKKQLFHTSNR